MDSLQFQHLIAALGELTQVQRQTVAAILCGHGELAEVTSVIDAGSMRKSSVLIAKAQNPFALRCRC